MIFSKLELPLLILNYLKSSFFANHNIVLQFYKQKHFQLNKNDTTFIDIPTRVNHSKQLCLLNTVW